MQVAIVNKTVLDGNKVALTVRPRLGHIDPQTGVCYGKEIVIIVPSSHKLAQEEQYWRDTGQREANGNPIVVLDKRSKTIEELSEADIVEILADLTERLTALELLIK